MKISLIEPISFCEGVKNALKIVDKAISEYPDTNIYVYGEIIHNDFVIEEYKNKGVKFLQKNINSIKDINEGVFIIPAHGAPKEIVELATAKSLIIYDDTCQFIKENIREIKEALTEGKKVVYIGDKDHDESKAILSISNDIYLKDKKLLNNYYNITNNNLVITCQSTLQKDVLNSEISEVLNAFPNAKNIARVCNTTSIRQNAIINLESDVDLVIVVGDKASNNTNKLYDTVRTHHKDVECVLIENAKQLNESMIQNKNHIAIASGASTPMYLIDAVVNYLNNFR